MNKLTSEFVNDYSSPYTNLEWNDQSTMYPGFCMTTPPTTAIMYDPVMAAAVHPSPHHHHHQPSASPVSYHHHHPGSPDSFTSIPTTPPIQSALQEPPVLVQSSSTSTQSSLNETIAKASSLPEAFYPEFLQYSKESYEQSAGRHNLNNKKRKSRDNEDDLVSEPKSKKQQRQQPLLDSPSNENSDDTDENGLATTAEMRRQIHIQSEQKRRAQIKDGFEELRSELPACLNKKMSKVALLHRTVQHIQHLKSTQTTILAELERLVHENEQLRSFQQTILQKQALENMYSMSNSL
ncbi:uncharacterized protein BX664DRAFT_331363 [Halteromyces radiatus]|uniref:uncharacterized protein n=1 Tax=Halteromyces radiatus TaxID=101107 RepID=UPI002220CC3E|nr:uncharacterized protein BX664DRAFT_331363 [Halteromyces radiatus]KAI8088782.1 hypothetical protein BX664DRAFT_331363 [Halteromyces radiatus]